MKNNIENICIYCGAKVRTDETIKYLVNNGATSESCFYGKFPIGGYYHVCEGSVRFSFFQPKDKVLIKLPKELILPRVMFVSDNNSLWHKSVVIHVDEHLKFKYICAMVENIDDYQKGNCSLAAYPLAMELDKKPPVKMTVAEIANKLGYEIEIIK